MKIAVWIRLVRAMQRSEALDLFPVGVLAQTRTERHRRLELATGFGSQTVWNRSNHRTVTGGSSIAATIFKAPPQFGQCSMSMSKTRLSSLA